MPFFQRLLRRATAQPPLYRPKCPHKVLLDADLERAVRDAEFLIGNRAASVALGFFSIANQFAVFGSLAEINRPDLRIRQLRELSWRHAALKIADHLGE